MTTKPVTKKKCSQCKTTKKIDEFAAQPHRSGGRHPWCKPCVSTYHREYRLRSPKLRYGHMMKQRYGITYEEYETMCEEQNNVCAVCLKSNQQYDKIKGDYRRLHVDHDHVTGKVRGLLCSGCNAALGHARDDVETLKRLIKYLEKSK